MGKLKEHLFTIFVAGTAVLLLILAYFFVYGPYSELDTTKKTLEAETRKLSSLNAKKFVPNKPYMDYLEERKAQQAADLKVAESYYESRQQAFASFFEDARESPSLGSFSPQYNTSLQNLINEYRAKFQIQVPEGQADQTPPVVDRFPLDPSQAEKQVPQAMKEYWITEAVFKACMELGIGGLKEVRFDGRTARAEKGAEHPYHKVVEAQVFLNIPFSKIENLLTRLYASPRVLLQLQELEMKKDDQAALEKFKNAVRRQEYPNIEESQDKKYEDIVPEPDTALVLKLQAVDWTGIPPEPEAKGDEKTETETKTTKPPK